MTLERFLQKGDTIVCRDINDVKSTFKQLQKMGCDGIFRNRDGELLIEITEVPEGEDE